MEGLIRGLALTFDDKTFFSAFLTIDGLILEYFLVNSRQKKTIFLYFIFIPCTSQDSLFFFPSLSSQDYLSL